MDTAIREVSERAWKDWNGSWVARTIFLAFAGATGYALWANSSHFPKWPDWLSRSVAVLAAAIVWSLLTVLWDLAKSFSKVLQDKDQKILSLEQKVNDLTHSNDSLTLQPVQSANRHYLEVQNSGPSVVLRGRIRIYVDARCSVFDDMEAQWSGEDDVRATLARNESKRLLLADYQAFPTLHRWEVHLIVRGTVTSTTYNIFRNNEDRAEHPDSVGPNETLLIELRIFAEPEFRNGPLIRRIRLREEKLTYEDTGAQS